MKQRLFLLVQNQPTALPRVLRLLVRHDINLESLSVKPVRNSDHLKITVSAGDNSISQQLVKLLQKLIEVVNVKLVLQDEIINKKKALLKISVNAKTRSISGYSPIPSGDIKNEFVY